MVGSWLVSSGPDPLGALLEVAFDSFLDLLKDDGLGDLGGGGWTAEEEEEEACS